MGLVSCTPLHARRLHGRPTYTIVPVNPTGVPSLMRVSPPATSSAVDASLASTYGVAAELARRDEHMQLLESRLQEAEARATAAQAASSSATERLYAHASECSDASATIALLGSLLRERERAHAVEVAAIISAHAAATREANARCMRMCARLISEQQRRLRERQACMLANRAAQAMRFGEAFRTAQTRAALEERHAEIVTLHKTVAELVDALERTRLPIVVSTAHFTE